MKSKELGVPRELLADIHRIGWDISRLGDLIREIAIRDAPEHATEDIKSRLTTFFGVCVSLVGMGEPSDVVEIKQMLAQGEGPEVEFKSTMKWNLKTNARDREMDKEIARALAGFLNSLGGTLFIGVDDDGNVMGLEQDLAIVPGKRPEGFMRVLADLISNYLGGNQSRLLIPRWLCIDARDICVVNVKPSPRPVYFVDGDQVDFYVRFVTQTRKLNVRDAVQYTLAHWTRDQALM